MCYGALWNYVPAHSITTTYSTSKKSTWFLGPVTYVIQRKIRCLAPVLKVNIKCTWNLFTKRQEDPLMTQQVETSIQLENLWIKHPFHSYRRNQSHLMHLKVRINMLSLGMTSKVPANLQFLQDQKLRGGLNSLVPGHWPCSARKLPSVWPHYGKITTKNPTSNSASVEKLPLKIEGGGGLTVDF